MTTQQDTPTSSVQKMPTLNMKLAASKNFQASIGGIEERISKAFEKMTEGQEKIIKGFKDIDIDLNFGEDDWSRGINYLREECKTLAELEVMLELEEEGKKRNEFPEEAMARNTRILQSGFEDNQGEVYESDDRVERIADKIFNQRVEVFRDNFKVVLQKFL